MYFLKLSFARVDMAIRSQEPLAAFRVRSPISEERLMSTSAVSSSPSLYQQLQQYFGVRHSDLNQLGQALSSGDLAGAQSAYNKIVTLGQQGPKANGNPFISSQREQAFANIGQALQSGDLAGAQQAFAALQSQLQSGHRQLDPPINPSPVSGPEIVLNLSSGSSGSSPEQIAINISNPAGGGEQISLSIGGQGSSAQQVTFNLPSNTNEQIVLNLLGPSSGTSSTSTPSTTNNTSWSISISA
jgi:hypothetical protein